MQGGRPGLSSERHRNDAGREGGRKGRTDRKMWWHKVKGGREGGREGLPDFQQAQTRLVVRDVGTMQDFHVVAVAGEREGRREGGREGCKDFGGQMTLRMAGREGGREGGKEGTYRVSSRSTKGVRI